MKFKTLKVTNFGGINPNSPIIIDFSKSKHIVATGDNGTNKTSLLNALLVACGALSKDNKNFVNNETGKIDIDFEFQGKDRLNYTVKVTKSSFSLLYEGDKVPEPVSKMKELLGIVGVSPMSVKDRPLKDIVRFLSAYLNKDADEFEAEMTKLRDAIKKSQDTRAAANKSAKGLTEFLSNEAMFTDWEASEKKYVEKKDINELSKKLDVAGKKADLMLKADIKLTNHKDRKQGILKQTKQLEDQIKQIQEQIKLLSKDLEQVNTDIETGEKYILENKDASKIYDQVKKEYDGAAQEVVNFERWQEIKRKKVELDEFEDISQKADAKEKELKSSVKQLQAEILPDIKGVELYTEDTHEGEKLVKEGLYWNGRNVAQLSETEWFALVMEIWRKYKVRAIVIDNYQSLGSMGASILEKLSKDGAYILAAEMNREQKNLEIIYE